MESFDISQLGELAKSVEATVQGAIRRGVYGAALHLLAHIKSTVIPNTPTDVPGTYMPVGIRGAYRAAWEITKTPQGADVYNSLPYASIIEWGARAKNIKVGRKMIDALTEWVVAKGFVKPEPGQDPAKAARAAAFGIAMAMTKRGIFDEGRGLRVMARAMLKAQEFIQAEVTSELAR